MTHAWSRTLLGAVSSLIVWGVHFAAVYALVGVGCEAGWDRSALIGTNRLTAVLIGATLPAVGAIAWIGWAGWRTRVAAHAARTSDRTERGRFMGLLTAALAVTALIATLMTTVPVMMLPPCELN